MLIRCPKCNVSYDIGAAAIPADGKKVRCSQCGEVWICMPADLFEQPQPEPPAPETEEQPVPETPVAEETGEAETPQEKPGSGRKVGNAGDFCPPRNPDRKPF